MSTQPPLPTHGKLVEELWEHFVKGALARPTFVMDFPLDTSPLVREHRSIPGVVEKWDLYVRGFELATGYSELIDPVIQRERFTEQAKLAARGDVEAMRIDEEFLRALEHGMPPSGGIGMGIDRLLMAITGLGIRETISSRSSSSTGRLTAGRERPVRQVARAHERPTISASPCSGSISSARRA